MTLRERTRELVADHWARMLGCESAAFERDGATVVPADSREVSLLARDEAVVVAAPAALAVTVRSRLADLLELAEGDRERAAAVLDVPVARVLGPQFLGYADAGTFSPVERGARLLDGGDADAVAALEAAVPAAEWQDGGLAPVAVGEDPVAGSFADGALAAVATVSEVREDVAGVGVVAHPGHRGEGHAKAAVSRVVRHALAAGFAVVEYRTLERWRPSVGLATDLGFERWGVSRLVTLDA